MRRPRSLFKYFDDRRWAEAFLRGQVRFQTFEGTATVSITGTAPGGGKTVTKLQRVE